MPLLASSDEYGDFVAWDAEMAHWGLEADLTQAMLNDGWTVAHEAGRSVLHEGPLTDIVLISGDDLLPKLRRFPPRASDL